MEAVDTLLKAEREALVGALQDAKSVLEIVKDEASTDGTAMPELELVLMRVKAALQPKGADPK